MDEHQGNECIAISARRNSTSPQSLGLTTINTIRLSTVRATLIKICNLSYIPKYLAKQNKLIDTNTYYTPPPLLIYLLTTNWIRGINVKRMRLLLSILEC